MKNTSNYREILLVSNSNYLKRDWCELKATPNDKMLSHKEQLIRLCWNGMLPEMLPEICIEPPNNKSLTLWEICETDSFLDLRYGDLDNSLNDEWSVNPYFFMKLAVMN